MSTGLYLGNIPIPMVKVVKYPSNTKIHLVSTTPEPIYNDGDIIAVVQKYYKQINGILIEIPTPEEE